jgi:exonuclease SbcC
MRLHRLEVTAFGPYAETEVVDFDRLSGDRLFLLYGETGGGKTTVLDAVAFALFGEVPGVRQLAKRLRSDHARPEVAPEVALEATVGGERLRVTRSPAWDRPKRRGEGTTPQPARATLARQDGDGRWVEEATRVPEVAQRVGDLVGMTAQQFFQVAMLPQGEFARFLRAEAEDRKPLLEKLFGTERFGAVEKWFLARRRESEESMRAVDRRIDRLLSQVEQAAGIEMPVGEEAEEFALEIGPEYGGPLGAGLPGPLGWAEHQRTRSAEAAESAQAAADEAASVLDARRRDLDGLAALHERHRRRAAASADLRGIDEERPAHADRQDELAGARRAAPVRPCLARALAARKALDEALEQVEAARVGLAQFDPEVGRTQLDLFGSDRGSPVDPVHLAAYVRTVREEVAVLDQLAAEESVLEAENAVRARLDGDIDRLADERERLADERETLPERLATAGEALAGAREAAGRVGVLRTVVDGLARMVAAADGLEPARQLLAARRDARQEAVDVHQRAVDEVQRLRRSRLEGMAAELARDLADGAPCTVCGSVDHPSPAATTASVVTVEQEEAAEAVASRLATKRETAENAEQEASREEAALLRVLDGREPDDVRREHEERSAMLAEAGRLAAGLEAASGELERMRAAEADLDERAVAADRERAELVARRSALADQIEDRTRRLAAARGEDPSVRARAQRLGATADAAEQLLEAEREHQRRLADRDQAEAALDAAAVGAGFDGPDDAVAAIRDGDRVAALEADVSEFREREAAVRAVLAEPDIAALADEPFPPIGPAEAAVAEAGSAHEAAVVVAARARHAADALARLTGELRQVVADTAPDRSAHAELAALADLVNGQGANTRKMTLQSFVLAARLEEVATAATSRLRRMSAGRYAFQHSDAAGPRGARGGLGLDVVDDYSGQVRSARTLSGGESFLASLALALGLADVVSAESGGVRLDTLFVDEGFGSLDAETLDAVMDTLDELRAGGRVVGLVSHVEEMKTRIPVRLRVRKGRTGSTITLEGVPA